MHKSLRFWLAIVLFVGVGAAACSDASNNNKAGEQNATVEPDAADDPTPEPTATVEPTPTPLPERVTIEELLASESPLNIAHAGGDQSAPHSTFFAFDNAMAAGADMLEIDVQLSGDGVLIVQHDDTVDKTTDETGPVADRTFDELAELDAGHWFATECWPCRDLPDESYIYRGVRTGESDPPEGSVADDFRIISFAELVERYPRMPFDIEIKGSGEDALPVVEALAIELEKFDLADNVIVVSFDDAAIAAFKEAMPDVATSPGVGEMTGWLLAGTGLTGNHPVVQVPPDFDGLEVINDDFWVAVEEAGVDVWVWPSDASTQENAEFYQEMLDQGATGIIAGRPEDVPG